MNAPDAGFTATGDPVAEARVRADLDRIVERVRRGLPKLDAILLVGGFGRGEGACVPGPDGPRPQNDYDVELIGEGLPSEAELAPMGADLAREIGIDWVDLHVHAPADLKRLVRDTQYGRDLAHGSRVLFDRKGLELPDVAEDAPLPWVEAEKILLARLWGLLVAWPDARRDARPGVREFLDRQLAKTALAILDAELMFGDRYATSYRAKHDRFRTLERADDGLAAWVDWAIAHKLGARDVAPPADGEEGWLRLRDLHLGTLFRRSATHYGRHIDDAASYAKAFPGLGRRDPLGMAVNLLKRQRTAERRDRELAKLFLAAARRPDGVDAGDLGEAVRRAAAFGYSGDADWTAVRDAITPGRPSFLD